MPRSKDILMLTFETVLDLTKKSYSHLKLPFYNLTGLLLILVSNDFVNSVSNNHN